MSLPAYTVIRPARPRRRRRMAEWLARNLDGLLIWAGAALITTALHYGADFTLGWWWIIFWFGVGIIYGAVRAS